MDSDGSGALDFTEYSGALKSYKVGASDEEIQTLFAIFDKNNDGTIVFDEFLNALIGELSDCRRRLVKEAFVKLDANGNKFLEVDEVKGAFDATRHPDV